MLKQFESALPEEIKMGWISYMVREYIPNPIRCHKCQRMGRFRQCHSNQRCQNVEVNTTMVNLDAKLKCCNCGWEHIAAFGGCAVQVKTKEIQKYKVINNMSHAEALKRVNDKMQRTVTHEEVVSGEEGRPSGGLGCSKKTK